MAAKGSRIPPEHLEILKSSGILNTDITLEKIIKAAADLDAVMLDGDAEVSVPTLVGPFFVYHAIDKINLDKDIL